MAVRNLGSEYCMAPEAITKGTSGNGGGINAGTKIAAKPQRSKVFIEVSVREFFREGFFAAFAREAESKESAQHRTGCRHDGVVEPQMFVARGKQDGGDIHASRDRDYRTIE